MDDGEGDSPLGKSYDDKLRSIPEFDYYRNNAPFHRPQPPLRSRPVRRWGIDEVGEESEIW